MRESDLLEAIYAANSALPSSVTIPPGDDMGGITFADKTLLIAVDQLIGGVHFDPAYTSTELIGRKAITRNLSDVAAMAALPVAAVASACLPREFEHGETLARAMRDTAAAHNCPLIGGDIATSDGPMMLSVTVLAEPAGVDPVLRRDSKPGDLIYVTGVLGGSFSSDHHLTFEPRIELARKLPRPNAMIDLSDGLAQDLPRLVAGARIDRDALPIRNGSTWQGAVGDGEDYELLFTQPADANMPSKIDGVSITRIGIVTDEPGIFVDDTDIAGMGWEHGT